MAIAGRVQKSRAKKLTRKAREPLVRWPEVALAMGMAKRTLLGVKAPPARTILFVVLTHSAVEESSITP